MACSLRGRKESDTSERLSTRACNYKRAVWTQAIQLTCKQLLDTPPLHGDQKVHTYKAPLSTKRYGWLRIFPIPTKSH